MIDRHLMRLRALSGAAQPLIGVLLPDIEDQTVFKIGFPFVLLLDDATDSDCYFFCLGPYAWDHEITATVTLFILSGFISITFSHI